MAALRLLHRIVNQAGALGRPGGARRQLLATTSVLRASDPTRRSRRPEQIDADG
jgi:hypothetical protein